MKMETAKFYVDWCLEAGSEDGIGNVCKRYGFMVALTAEEYYNLYKIWFEQDGLNSWHTKWDGYEDLYKKINEIAVYSLNQMLEREEPAFVNPVEVLWELSEETIKAF